MIVYGVSHFYDGLRNQKQSSLGVLRNFAKFTRKHLWQSLLFNKIAGLTKETLAQVFSCEFYEISENSSFYRTPLMAASVVWNILMPLFRSSRSQMFLKIRVFQNFANMTGKNRHCILFLIKLIKTDCNTGVFL